MKILLQYRWAIDNQEQDYIWKIVDMPCVPAVGTTMFLSDDTGGDYIGAPDVEAVQWWECWPSFYVVVLGVEYADETAEFLNGMKLLGWSEGPFDDALDFAATPPARR